MMINITLQYLKMQKKPSRFTLLVDQTLGKYRQNMIKLNQQYQTSIYFMITIQVLRFVFGHSQIFCIFMIKTNNQNIANVSFFQQIRNEIISQSQQDNFYLQTILIAISFISIIVFLLFSLKQQFQKKYNIMKIVYIVGHLMEVSSEFLLSVFAIIIYTSIQSGNYQILIPIIPGMLITILFFKFTVIFQQKSNFETKDIYAHSYNLKVEIFNIIFCFLTFFGTLSSLFDIPKIVEYFIIGIWMLFQILKLKHSVFQSYYEKLSTNYIYYLIICLQTVQIAVFTTSDLSNLQLIQQNVLVLTILITIFLYWSAINCQQFIQYNSYFYSFDDLKTAQDIYLLFNSYYVALQGLKGNNSVQICLIVSSIKKNHQNNCKQPDCYCQHSTQPYNFMKCYIHQQLIRIQKTFQKDKKIKFFLMNFKFHLFHFYSNLHEQIQKFKSQHRLNILEKFQIFSLMYKVQKWINSQNKKAGSISICIVLDFQDQMHQLNDIMLKDITYKFQKWSLLAKKLCKIQEIKQLSYKELQCTIQVQAIRQKRWNTFSRSLAFNSIIYFYFKRILLKISDLNKIQQNIIDLSRKIKQQELKKPHIFLKNIFNRSAFDQQSMGVVIQVSKAVLNVFGYSQQKMIGKNVACLIPRFLSQSHDLLMREWVQKGGAYSSSKISQVFCLHNDNYVFSALKYFKIHASQKGIHLITTFYKKNDNDMVLIDSSMKIQCVGKNFRSILKHIPPNLYVDYVFKNMKQKICKASFTQEKQQKTIVYNQAITHQLCYRKKYKEEQARTDDEVISTHQSLQKHVPQKTMKYDDIWKMSFKYIKMKLKDNEFVAINVKTLEYIQFCDQDKSKNVDDDYQQLSERQNFNEQLQVEEMKQVQMIQQQQNSSMASYNSQLGYGISKMITIFSEMLFNPHLLNDKRAKIKLFMDFAFFFALITISLSTLILNQTSLQDKVTVLRAKSSIDRTFHLMQISTNHVYNAYMYRKDLELQKLAIEQTIWDSNKFSTQVAFHFKTINDAVSILKTEPIYDYLQTPLQWKFPDGQFMNIELLQFFKMTYYVGSQIKNQLNKKFQNQTANFTLTTYLFTMLGLNVATLRSIRETLNTMTQDQLTADSQLNQRVLISALTLFFCFSLAYAIIINHNSKFRFHQIENQTNLYEMVSSQTLQNLKDYYFTYYHHFVNQNIRIDCSFINNETFEFEREFDDEAKIQLNQYNKIKFFGHSKYLMWIVIVIVFLAINAGSLLIEINMYKFNTEVQFFSRITNYISESQSILLNRLIRLKAKYYFDKANLNQLFLDTMLSRLQITQVLFDSYVTFSPNWITEKDQTFLSQFNDVIVKNPCVLNRQSVTDRQFQICKQFEILSQNGIITFVNGFSRRMRNTYLGWKKNLSFILNQTDYLSTRSQFKEIDFGLTFHVQTFGKLSQKIINVYEKGFMGEYQTCLIIFFMLALVLTVILLWSIKKYQQDRHNLSFLYGFILLIPSTTVKKSKYIVKFLQKNLEFQQKY